MLVREGEDFFQNIGFIRGLRSLLPLRSVLGSAHRAPGPPSPRKGMPVPGLPQRGSHKQYPPSLTPSAAPGVTEGVSPKIPQGEAQKNFPVRPGCASKIPERPLWRNFPVPRVILAPARLTRQKPLPGFLHAQIAPQEKSCYTKKSKAPRGLGGVKA